MEYFDLILHAFLTHLHKPLRAPLKLLVSELPLAPVRNLGVLRLALLVTGEAVQRSVEVAPDALADALKDVRTL